MDKKKKKKKKSQFRKKNKTKQNKNVSKWRPNTRFLFRVIPIFAKIWKNKNKKKIKNKTKQNKNKNKNTFPKELFNEIWLEVGEYEYIYITEITLK